MGWWRSQTAFLLALALSSGLARADQPGAEQARQLLSQAKAAYFEGRNDKAHEDIGRAHEILRVSHLVPVDLRIRLALWRTALFIQDQRVDDAAAAAREVIALDPIPGHPKVPLDPTEFPPALIAFMGEQRSHTTVSWVDGRIVGVPPGSRVWVDGLFVNAPPGFRVPPFGRHWLQVDPPDRPSFDADFVASDPMPPIDVTELARKVLPPRPKTLLWVGLGAGAAVILAAGALALQSGGSGNSQTVYGTSINAGHPW